METLRITNIKWNANLLAGSASKFSDRATLFPRGCRFTFIKELDNISSWAFPLECSVHFEYSNQFGKTLKVSKCVEYLPFFTLILEARETLLKGHLHFTLQNTFEAWSRGTGPLRRLS